MESRDNLRIGDPPLWENHQSRYLKTGYQEEALVELYNLSYSGRDSNNGVERAVPLQDGP